MSIYSWTRKTVEDWCVGCRDSTLHLISFYQQNSGWFFTTECQRCQHKESSPSLNPKSWKWLAELCQESLSPSALPAEPME